MRYEKAESLLKLALKLAGTAEGMTLDEMAAFLGTSRRTAERMRDAVRDLYPAMEDIADLSHKRYRIRGGLDRLFQAPTAEELVELGNAANGLRAAGATRRASALESLEAKLRASMADTLLRRLDPDVEALARAEVIVVQPGPRPSEEESVLATLRHAIISLKTVRFVYTGGTNPGTARDIVPLGLMVRGATYLVGTIPGSTSPRHYRLDRIEHVQLLNDPASIPADFNIRDYAARSFGIYQEEPSDVVLRVLPSSAAKALAWRFHPSQVIEPQSDRSVIVRFSAGGLLELAWHLFSWRDQIEILHPARLKETMVAELKKALARHTE